MKIEGVNCVSIDLDEERFAVSVTLEFSDLEEASAVHARLAEAARSGALELKLHTGREIKEQ